MKQPKKLTRSEKEKLTKKGKNCDEWLSLPSDDEHYCFIHKTTKEILILERGK